MRLVSAVGGCGTNCQIINRIRDRVDTTSAGDASATLVLAAEPLCRHCAERGQVTPADLVDHIIPLPSGNYSIDNLQPLCSRCHAVKTAAERTAKG